MRAIKRQIIQLEKAMARAEVRIRLLQNASTELAPIAEYFRQMRGE